MNKQKVLIISFAHFIHDIFSSLLAPMLPLLIEKMGITLTQASLMESVRRSVSIINPLIGLMIERKDVKYFVILTPSITAISMGLLSITSSYAIGLFLLFIAGLSAALFHIPAPAMIKELSGKEIGKGMSYFMVGGESARTIGPLLGAAAFSIWGLEGVWKLTPIGIFASLFLYIKLKDYKPSFKAKKIEKNEIKTIIKKITPFFRSIAIFMSLNYTSRFGVSLFFPLFLTHNGFSVEKASIAFGIMQGAGILGALLSGKISDKIGTDKMLAISSIGSGITLILFLLFYKQALWIITLPLGFFLFSQSPGLLAIVNKLKSQTPTFINSIYMALNFIISSIIVYFIGLISEKIGLFDTFLITAILTLLSIFTIPYLKKAPQLL
ncbi:MAG: MFS transporter [Nautiliaceae bacterium]